MKFVTPTYKQNLGNFVRTHLSDRGIEDQEKDKGMELRVECPFCKGGGHHEFSFDVNIDRGVARCWRATCGWRGTGNRLFSEVMDVSKREAYFFLTGGDTDDVIMADLEAFDKLWLSTLWRNNDQEEGLNFQDEVINSVPLMDADEEIIAQVKEWIEGRRYNFIEFIQAHEILIPPQFGRWQGYVLFNFYVNDNVTYQGYKFDPELQGLDKRPGTEFKIPKTMAAKGNSIKKGLYRYNDIPTAKTVLLTEGIFDAARLMTYGFAATCCFSTNVSPIQAYLLSRLNVKEICICFDYGADAETQLAVKSILKYAESSGKIVSYIEMKQRGQDPDSMSEADFMKCLMKRKFVSNHNGKAILDEFSRIYGV